MNFIELESKRSAIRSYTSQPIEQDLLDQILKAARIAPTAANKQSQRLYVIHKEEMETLSEALNFHGADTAILVCCDHDAAWVRGYDQMNAGVIDASIVTTMMMMEAVDLGLGTLWVCAFDPAKIKEHFHLNETVEPVNILCLGYTDIESDPNRFTSTRYELEKTVLQP